MRWWSEDWNTGLPDSEPWASYRLHCALSSPAVRPFFGRGLSSGDPGRHEGAERESRGSGERGWAQGKRMAGRSGRCTEARAELSRSQGLGSALVGCPGSWELWWEQGWGGTLPRAASDLLLVKLVTHLRRTRACLWPLRHQGVSPRLGFGGP